MKISIKYIRAGYLLIVFLFLLCSIVYYLGLKIFSDSFNAMLQNSAEICNFFVHSTANIQKIVLIGQKILKSEKIASKEETKEIERLKNEIARIPEKFKAIWAFESEKGCHLSDYIEKFCKSHQIRMDYYSEFCQAPSAEKLQKFKKADELHSSCIVDLYQCLIDLENSIHQKLEEEKKQFSYIKFNTYLAVFITSIPSIIIVFIVLFFILYKISRFFRVIFETGEDISQGNLESAEEKTKHIHQNSLDEMNRVGKVFANLVSSLKGTFQSVTEVSVYLSEISQTLIAMSTGQTTELEKVSSSIAQTTASTQEMNASARQVENRANKVSSASRYSKSISQEAQIVVQHTIAGMDEIRKRVEKISAHISELNLHAKKIVNITSTIEDISAQTNMLALNAAIEAARAGEQGKGFSVVATHVRELAQRSGDASREIGTIIKEIQESTNSTSLSIEQGIKHVEEGFLLVQKTSESFQKMLDAMIEVEERSEEIRLAAMQQTTATEQIAQTIFDINDITQQSFTTSRQIQEWTNTLNEMSEKLIKILQQFRGEI